MEPVFANIRRMWIVCIFLLYPLMMKSQSMLMEISWNVYTQNYKGLLVMYPNNQGFLKIKTYIANIGWVWVYEDARMSFQYDFLGNRTTFINCYNPQTSPYVAWAADNFVVYSNGAMYTQDASGTWSTLISAYVVPARNWQNKFREYRIKNNR